MTDRTSNRPTKRSDRPVTPTGQTTDQSTDDRPYNHRSTDQTPDPPTNEPPSHQSNQRPTDQPNQPSKQPTNRVAILVGANFFLFSKLTRPDVGPIQSTVKGQCGSLPHVKRPRHEFNHRRSRSAAIRVYPLFHYYSFLMWV